VGRQTSLSLYYGDGFFCHTEAYGANDAQLLMVGWLSARLVKLS